MIRFSDVEIRFDAGVDGRTQSVSSWLLPRAGRRARLRGPSPRHVTGTGMFPTTNSVKPVAGKLAPARDRHALRYCPIFLMDQGCKPARTLPSLRCTAPQPNLREPSVGQARSAPMPHPFRPHRWPAQNPSAAQDSAGRRLPPRCPVSAVFVFFSASASSGRRPSEKERAPGASFFFPRRVPDGCLFLQARPRPAFRRPWGWLREG